MDTGSDCYDRACAVGFVASYRAIFRHARDLRSRKVPQILFGALALVSNGKKLKFVVYACLDERSESAFVGLE